MPRRLANTCCMCHQARSRSSALAAARKASSRRLPRTGASHLRRGDRVGGSARARPAARAAWRRPRAQTTPRVPANIAADGGGTRRRRSSLSLRASWKPFGIGEQRPNNFREVARAAWENRDRPRYAWRILNQGVCDGCALGTKGMRDWTIDGVHLCNIRLRLLRLNTMPALDPAVLDDAAALEKRSSAELRGLGRLPFPLRAPPRRPRASPGSSWDEALDLAAERIRAAGPERVRHLPDQPRAPATRPTTRPRRRRERWAPTRSTTPRAYATRPARSGSRRRSAWAPPPAPTPTGSRAT